MANLREDADNYGGRGERERSHFSPRNLTCIPKSQQETNHKVVIITSQVQAENLEAGPRGLAVFLCTIDVGGGRRRGGGEGRESHA